MIIEKLQSGLRWLIKDGQLPKGYPPLTRAERRAFMMLDRRVFTPHLPRFDGDLASVFLCFPCDQLPEGAIRLSDRVAYTPHFVEPGCEHACRFYFLKF